jgi:hypothetical protein
MIGVAAAQGAGPAVPQEKPAVAPPPAPKIGPLQPSVVWRTRFEMWNWFDAPGANDSYGYLNSLLRAGVGQTRGRLDWRIEFAQPTVLGAPDNAMAPPPQGALGLGAAYYGANKLRSNYATAFLKQGFVQFRPRAGAALKAGRFEFFDGTEVPIADPTLSGLVQSRVGHRLISNEAFPAAQRSFDGALFTWNSGPNNATAFGARSTAGGVHLNGWKELAIEVFYGAYNRAVKGGRGVGSFRTFVVGYVDHRDDVVKPDNRPAPIRTADRDTIALATFGANYAQVLDAQDAGTVDVIGWVAVQTGSWGALSQRAWSGFAEAGWQPRDVAFRPWIRGGYRYSSGDSDPADDRNGTFYQVFGATRQYAKFPFYNLMNLTDAYLLVALRPRPDVTVRSELHGLTLADRADLWYGGGGPGQSDAFGYAGRPSQGSDSLATLWDLGVDTTLIPHLGVNLYYGFASGGDVIERTYPKNANGQFAFIETVLRF